MLASHLSHCLYCPYTLTHACLYKRIEVQFLLNLPTKSFIFLSFVYWYQPRMEAMNLVWPNGSIQWMSAKCAISFRNCLHFLWLCVWLSFLAMAMIIVLINSIICTLYGNRNRILQDIDRFINPDQVINRVVYDLDDIVCALGSSDCQENSNLNNTDENK